MLQDQLRYGILIALITVGLFCRGMLCKQNNEGPSSSNSQQTSSGPSITDSANSQHNDIKADEAEDSSFYQIPTLGEVQPDIQQDKANSQHNSIQAKSVKKSKFYQIPVLGRVTHPMPINFLQDQYRCGILIGSMAMGLLVILWRFIAAGLLKLFKRCRGMLCQQNNEGRSSPNSQQTSSGLASGHTEADEIEEPEYN